MKRAFPLPLGNISFDTKAEIAFTSPMPKNTTTINAAREAGRFAITDTVSAVSWADSTPAQRSHSGSGEGWCLFASVVGVFVLLGVFVAQIFASN